MFEYERIKSRPNVFSLTTQTKKSDKLYNFESNNKLNIVRLNKKINESKKKIVVSHDYRDKIYKINCCNTTNDGITYKSHKKIKSFFFTHWTVNPTKWLGVYYKKPITKDKQLDIYKKNNEKKNNEKKNNEKKNNEKKKLFSFKLYAKMPVITVNKKLYPKEYSTDYEKILGKYKVTYINYKTRLRSKKEINIKKVDDLYGQIYNRNILKKQFYFFLYNDDINTCFKILNENRNVLTKEESFKILSSIPYIFFYNLKYVYPTEKNVDSMLSKLIKSYIFQYANDKNIDFLNFKYKYNELDDYCLEMERNAASSVGATVVGVETGEMKGVQAMTEETTEEMTGKTTEEMTGEMTGKTTGETTGKTTEETTEEMTGKTTDKTTDKTTGKTTEETMGKTTEETTGETTEETMGKTTGETAKNAKPTYEPSPIDHNTLDDVYDNERDTDYEKRYASMSYDYKIIESMDKYKDLINKFNKYPFNIKLQKAQLLYTKILTMKINKLIEGFRKHESIKKNKEKKIYRNARLSLDVDKLTPYMNLPIKYDKKKREKINNLFIKYIQENNLIKSALILRKYTNLIDTSNEKIRENIKKFLKLHEYIYKCNKYNEETLSHLRMVYYSTVQKPRVIQKISEVGLIEQGENVTHKEVYEKELNAYLTEREKIRNENLKKKKNINIEDLNDFSSAYSMEWLPVIYKDMFNQIQNEKKQKDLKKVISYADSNTSYADSNTSYDDSNTSYDDSNISIDKKKKTIERLFSGSTVDDKFTSTSSGQSKTKKYNQPSHKKRDEKMIKHNGERDFLPDLTNELKIGSNLVNYKKRGKKKKKKK
ncbi:conserved protein, unknown function [Hepatocystis sp. ex Piliocolobus tephrosceles]|nr:conserved protein, unknown function [Hepatocystis sp. ex Piliocolobus tephrosceles]